jgi:ribosomal protein S18 acetylase RimI-like enzyme
MTIEIKPAPPDLASEYIRLRGSTRENAISQERLKALGITAETWANDIRTEELQGVVALSDQQLVGYCFGSSSSGEIVVLAVRPAFEGQDIGQRLLTSVVELLNSLGHVRLFLGCSSDPTARSYGFYRHLGWRSTGTVDERGDEILELVQK